MSEEVETEVITEEETPQETVEEATEEAATEDVIEETPEETVEEEPAAETPVYVEQEEELSRPRVIDLAKLLTPISAESPSGEYARYSGVYDEINEARREDDDLAQGDWQVERKLADYRKVIDLAVPVLETETKDMQICAWLSESLVREHGFEGLRDSLKLMSEMQNFFWDTIHPEIDEGDMEGRANALAWMDKESAFSIKASGKLTDVDGYSFFDYEDSKKYKIPDDIDSLDSTEQEEIRTKVAKAERDGKVTDEYWEKSIAKSKRAFYEELNNVIQECWEEYRNLNKVVEEKFDIKQAPGLRQVGKVLETIQDQTDKILEKKREEEPDPIEDLEVTEDGEGGSSNGTGGGVTTTRGAINNRRDALRRLGDLADYFRKTEPHSPVSYLVNRAVKWGNMPLDSWLQDVIKDENVLYQLRETLGFNTAESDGSSEEPVIEQASEDSW